LKRQLAEATVNDGWYLGATGGSSLNAVAGIDQREATTAKSPAASQHQNIINLNFIQTPRNFKNS